MSARSPSPFRACSSRAPGQRLGVYVAERGTPDYDAMVLLDMTAHDAAKPASQQQHRYLASPSPLLRRGLMTVNGMSAGRV
jgi:hypothetical protein